MQIDGRALAHDILVHLAVDIRDLAKKGTIPTLAVILVGDDLGSRSYIRQKQNAAEQIGAKLILSHQQSDVSYQQLQKIIEEFNDNPAIHGIILQRPLPESLDAQSISLCSTILLSKDVDGFLPNSPYPVPVAAAVLKIIEFAFSASRITHHALTTKHIVVVGRGETAGKPIVEALIKRGCNVTIVHSQTPNPDEMIKTADIVISCVGKPNVVRRDNIKKGAILASIGLWRDSEGKLHGDYEEDDVKDVASFYTLTPGGVGPVNVACLMANLVNAAHKLL